MELESQLLLVGLEERAVAHVELEDRSADRVRHVRGRHDERLAAQKAQPLEQHDLLRLRQLEHRRDVRRDGLHLEPQHLRLQPLAPGAEVLVEARQRLRDELRHLRLGDERPFALESCDEAGSLEVAQRLADDGPAHVVALAQRGLGRDLLAGREYAVGDRALEQLAELVVERDRGALVDRARDPGRRPVAPQPSVLAHEDTVITTCLHYNIAWDNVGRCVEAIVLGPGSLVGIVRFHEGGDVSGAMAALVRGGIEQVEVTIDTPGALAAVAARRRGGKDGRRRHRRRLASRCEPPLRPAPASSSVPGSSRR